MLRCTEPLRGVGGRLLPQLVEALLFRQLLDESQILRPDGSIIRMLRCTEPLRRVGGRLLPQLVKALLLRQLLDESQILRPDERIIRMLRCTEPLRRVGGRLLPQLVKALLLRQSLGESQILRPDGRIIRVLRCTEPLLNSVETANHRTLMCSGKQPDQICWVDLPSEPSVQAVNQPRDDCVAVSFFTDTVEELTRSTRCD